MQRYLPRLDSKPPLSNIEAPLQTEIDQNKTKPETSLASNHSPLELNSLTLKSELQRKVIEAKITRAKPGIAINTNNLI